MLSSTIGIDTGLVKERKGKGKEGALEGENLLSRPCAESSSLIVPSIFT